MAEDITIAVFRETLSLGPPCPPRVRARASALLIQDCAVQN
jgi:hypothetical protein